MKYYILIFLMLNMLFTSCVQDYNFPTGKPQALLVVDGFISDVSYNDMLTMPLYPRYFEVHLKYASPVSNIRDQGLSGAEVEIIDDIGESWDYTEDEPGFYRLYHEDFKVESNKTYYMAIKLQNGEVYHSSFESLPEPTDIGEITLEEAIEKRFENIAGQFRIREAKGLDISLNIPPAHGDQLSYNKMDFLTTYKVVAPFVRDLNNPLFICYITSIFENSDVILSKSKFGAKEKLFFLSTSNSRIIEGYSTLIRQQTLNKDHYQFWYDLQKQEEQADLFAPPPYNLLTNVEGQNTDKTVFGYFGVVREQFYRYNFDRKDLSYPLPVPEWYKGRCIDPLIPPVWCRDCTLTPLQIDDVITTEEPWWWYQ